MNRRTFIGSATAGALARKQSLSAARDSSGDVWPVQGGSGAVPLLLFAEIDQRHYRLYHSV